MSIYLDPDDLAAEEHSELMLQADKEEGAINAVEAIEPGLHWDLPNDTYHSLTDWWSSTQLKRQLPEKYDETSMSQAALDFGTLVHSVVLEPNNLGMYVVTDAETVARIGVKKDGSRSEKPTGTDAWRDFVKQARAEGTMLVTPEDWDRAHYMRDAILAHGEARELLFSDDGQSEVSAFATDENGVRHKARFDRLIPDEGVDLKTTGAKPGEDSLNRVVANYLYDLSAFHYLTVADLLDDLSVRKFTWVFASKHEPYRVTVAEAGKGWLDGGRVLRDLALARAAGETEPYEGSTGRLILEPPPWARRTTAVRTGIPADFEWSINDYA